jgi:O-antigen/teichoic acid export membrane protein
VTRAARFARHSLHFMLGEGSVFVLTIAVVPALIRALGAEGYALYAFMGIMTGYMTLLTLGAGPTTVKLISESVALGDQPRLWRAARLTMIAHIAAASAAALLLLSLRGFLTAKFLHISPDNLAQAHRIFSYTAAGGFLHLLSLWAASVLQGFQRFDLYNVVSVMRGGLIPVGCLALAASGRPLGELGIWFFASHLLVCGAGWAWAGKLLGPAYRASGKEKRPHEWKALAWYNLSALAAQLGWVVNFQLDKLWVGGLFPIADLAYYLVPSSLVQRLAIVPAIVGQVVFPMASEISGLGQKDSLKRLYLKSTKVILLAVLPFFIILFTYAPQILSIWLGEQFSVRGAWPMRLLLFGTSATILTVVAHHVALGLGRVGAITASTTTSSILSLLFWSYLIPRYGIMGAAMGACASPVLVAPPFIYFVTRRLVGVSAAEFLGAVLKPAATGVAMFLVAFFLRSEVFKLIPLVLSCGTILGVYYAVNFALLEAEEREMVVKLLKLEKRS